MEKCETGKEYNMKDKEKYSDRRRTEKRQDQSADSASEILLPGQNKRQGDRRSDPRRRNVRLNHSLEVSLADQSGKTINVSASGVYFEVETDDMEAFAPGTTLPVKIAAVDVEPGLEKELMFDGRGTVVRSGIVENRDHDNRLYVALEFTEKS